MAKSTITLEVDERLRDELAAVAERLGLSTEQLMKGLIRDCVSSNAPEMDQWLRAEIQTGLDEANAGLIATADEVEAEFRRRRMASGKANPGA